MHAWFQLQKVRHARKQKREDSGDTESQRTFAAVLVGRRLIAWSPSVLSSFRSALQVDKPARRQNRHLECDRYAVKSDKERGVGTTKTVRTGRMTATVNTGHGARAPASSGTLCVPFGMGRAITRSSRPVGREVVDHRVEARNGRWRMEWRSRGVVEAMDDDGRGFPTRSSSSSSSSAAIPRLPPRRQSRSLRLRLPPPGGVLTVGGWERRAARMTRWWISGGQRPYLWQGEKAQVPIMLIHAVHALTVTDTVRRACFEGGGGRAH